MSHDINASWVDVDAAGADSEDDLVGRMQHYLKVVGLEDDVYSIGLRQNIDPSERPELAENLLVARQKMRERLDEGKISDYVESFDADKFNLSLIHI